MEHSAGALDDWERASYVEWLRQIVTTFEYTLGDAGGTRAHKDPGHQVIENRAWGEGMAEDGLCGGVGMF